MSPVYHILNGDALKDRFPASIQGDLIVARECLVDGDVHGKNLNELFDNRARFISQTYGDYSKMDYKQETVSEFEKILSIPAQSVIYLWFEDDLFCQVNFWFVAYLLSNHTSINSAMLVRPKTHNLYGFGGLSAEELIDIYHTPLALKDLSQVSQLWVHYQSGDNEKLLEAAHAIEDLYPFILPAVQAQLDRLPKEDYPGRPMQSIMEIRSELNTTNFGAVFQEFNKRESIYGFGDLQVKRMFDQILRNEE